MIVGIYEHTYLQVCIHTHVAFARLRNLVIMASGKARILIGEDEVVPWNRAFALEAASQYRGD